MARIVSLLAITSSILTIVGFVMQLGNTLGWIDVPGSWIFIVLGLGTLVASGILYRSNSWHVAAEAMKNEAVRNYEALEVSQACVVASDSRYSEVHIIEIENRSPVPVDGLHVILKAFKPERGEVSFRVEDRYLTRYIPDKTDWERIWTLRAYEKCFIHLIGKEHGDDNSPKLILGSSNLKDKSCLTRTIDSGAYRLEMSISGKFVASRKISMRLLVSEKEKRITLTRL